MVLIGILVVIFLALTAAFFRVPLWLWSSIILIVLFLTSLYHPLTWIAFGISFVIWLFLNIPPLRRRYLTQSIFNKVRTYLPSISSTEREVLEAGDIWWEQELFCGAPNWKKFEQLKIPRLSQEEQLFLDNEVNELCQMLDDWEIILQQDLPEPVWDFIKKKKFWGLVIPKEYGGLGFSDYAHSTIIMRIATRSYSAAVNIMVPNSVGLAEFLQRYGTDEQKQTYLPKLACGEEITCFALTAPEAGSDAGSMHDVGIVCYGDINGEKVLGVKLNFEKRYITLAPLATLIGLAFKLYDPDHLLGDKKFIGITLAMVPRQHPGIEIGKRHWPLYMGFMNGPIRGKDVFIPLNWIIGGPTLRGKGWRMMMECLSVGRGISLPALSCAAAKLSYRMTGAYVSLRQQFHQPIGQFEGIQEALSRMGGYTFLCDATRHFTAIGISQGIKPSIATAITKYHLTEMSRKIVNNAMDVHGGRAVQVGPRNYLANIYIALPISITVEGANILTRNLIIFGQGALRCHPYVREEVAAIDNPDVKKGLKRFDKILIKHIGFALRNFVRTLVYGLTGGKFILVRSNRPERKYYQQISRMSAAFALVTDMAMLLLGGSLKKRERISARLGDIVSYLYLATAALKYYESTPELQSGKGPFFLEWSQKYCFYQIQKAFDRFFINFPYRWLAYFIRGIIFPWGKQYYSPPDFLDHEIASAMMEITPFREKLTEHCYVGNDENNIFFRMEKAFESLFKVEKILLKLKKAVQEGNISAKNNLYKQLEEAQEKNILTDEEIAQLKDFEERRIDAIKVDEFNHLPGKKS